MNEETLFHEVRQQPAGERRRFLEEACGGDLELQRRIEVLLEADDNPDSLLELKPPANVSPTIGQGLAERPGTQIGPYKLLQQIGEGGMGVVWMAEQTQPVQRKVALKVIKPGMDSRQVIARFEAERQALAMMDHVNIARVLDAGTTESGLPYFVMELVHGVPITQYCDDNHLTPRERLELFVPVCQAIQHAHQKGIIHRDLKPSNVMVTLYDGKPVPKVIDFGVAKATEQTLTQRTLFTQYGTMVGTLEYMSPEQAEMSALGVDTRSDIFSLGVLLYELLTGSTPLTHKRLKQAAYAEVLRLIKEEEPPKPSTRLTESGEAMASISAQRHMDPAKLTKLVRGELDWIVMKCLEKDRNRRYETASGFAADVQRYLNDETVQACPPSAGYRIRKFVRRNKAALAFSGLVLLILLTLTGGIGWNLRDRAARQSAVEHEVNLALNEAERWQEQAKWPEALSAAKRAEGLLAGGGSDQLGEHAHQLRKDVEMVLRLEEISLLSSEWKDDKFDYEATDPAYAKAFGDYGIDIAGLSAEEAAARIRGRAGVAVALSAALDDWAFARSKKTKAGGLALTAVAQASDPDSWRRQVRQAVQQKGTKALAALAASPELLRQPPNSLLVLARALRALGLTDARIEVLRQAQRQYPGDFWINFDLAETLSETGPAYRDEAVSFLRAAVAVRPQSIAALNNLGNDLKAQEKLGEAIACYRKAIELDPKFVFAHGNLGSALKAQGKLDEAIACYRRAIEIDPKSAAAHNNLGGFLCDVKRDYDGAITCFRNAIEIDPKSAVSHNNLGNALGKKGQLDEAIASCRRAIELNPKFANAHKTLGNVLFLQKKLDEAIACYRKAIELDPKLALAHGNLGNALNAQGKPDEAIACFRRAIEIDPKSAVSHNHLGCFLCDVKRDYDGAITCFRKALELDPKSALSHNNLGNALRNKGQLDEAIASCRRAIEIDPKLADAHNTLGNVLFLQKKLDEAIACYRKAIELDPKFVLAHGNLGSALKAQGKVDEAIAAYRKAVELDPKNVSAYYGLGFVLKHKGLVDEAIAAYRRAIELDPKHSDAHIGLGNALRSQGKVDEASACFRKVIDLDPKNALAHYNLGNDLRDQKKLDEAIGCYRTAIEIDPKYVSAYCNLGVALKTQGKVDDAIAAYRRAIELNPNSADFHCNLGSALLAQQKPDEAIAAYRKAIEIDPKNVSAYYGLGIALYAQKQLDQAIAAYRKAIELDPKYCSSYVNLGNALQDLNKLDDAIVAFRKAIELEPKAADAHYNLGNALKAQEKLDNAIASYHRAIELDPKYAKAYIGLGSALLAQQKSDEAIAADRKAIELDPKDAIAHYNLGNALLTQQKLDEAIGASRKAIELDPKLALAYYNLGTGLLSQQKLDEAIGASRKAIELDPKLAIAHNNLGRALKNQGKLDEAIVAFERAIELEPNNAFPQNELAWLLATCAEAKFRDPKRAVELAKKASDLDPKTNHVWNTLGAAHYRVGSWKDAVAALNKSMELRQGGNSVDWFFLSMSYWKLDNKDEARKWYAKAVEWMDQNKPTDQLLIRLRTEAEELLKITNEKPTTKSESN